MTRRSHLVFATLYLASSLFLFPQIALGQSRTCTATTECGAGERCPTTGERVCTAIAEGTSCPDAAGCGNGQACTGGRCTCTATGGCTSTAAAATTPTTPSAAPTTAVNERVQGTIRAPNLAVPIPDFEGFEVPQAQGTGAQSYVDIPFIAQYITAIYQYALGIVVTLATVMVVIGGLKWVLARGNSGMIEDAKETITRAVIGLLLALGTYTILNLINPELVNLRAIRVQLVQGIEVGDVEADPDAAALEGGGTALSGEPSGDAAAPRAPVTCSGTPPPRRSGNPPPLPNPATFRSGSGACVQVRGVDARLVPLLTSAGANLCASRGEHTEWKLLGQGYRSISEQLKKWLRNCYLRPARRLPNGRAGCGYIGMVLPREMFHIEVGQPITTCDASLQHLVPHVRRTRRGIIDNDAIRQLHDTWLPAAIDYVQQHPERVGHIRGLAVDLNYQRSCGGTANAECVAALTAAMRSAGFCRHTASNERHHFEPRGELQTVRSCN